MNGRRSPAAPAVREGGSEGFRSDPGGAWPSLDMAGTGVHWFMKVELRRKKMAQEISLALEITVRVRRGRCRNEIVPPDTVCQFQEEENGDDEQPRSHLRHGGRPARGSMEQISEDR